MLSSEKTPSIRSFFLGEGKLLLENILTLLLSEWSKLHVVLAILSAIGLIVYRILIFHERLVKLPVSCVY